MNRITSITVLFALFSVSCGREESVTNHEKFTPDQKSLTDRDTSRAKPLMKNFIGLNGHYKFRPKLYRQVCGLVRNYHSMNWDVKQPGDELTFPVCVNKVNWNEQVYGKWAKEGFTIDLCAMFGQFGESNQDYLKLWEGKEEWAFKYGFELASYFGPSGEQKLVSSIEIGNEPGSDFNDDLYQRIFIQMARGIRSADSKVKIVTAAAHVSAANKYEKSLFWWRCCT